MADGLEKEIEKYKALLQRQTITEKECEELKKSIINKIKNNN